MGSVTYVKFMGRDELVKMLTEIHRFTIKDKSGKTITLDGRLDRPKYETLPSGVIICWHTPAFKLSAFDMDDCLTSGEGYVRYNSYVYCSKRNPDTPQGKILMERYGFQRED